jgi:hypothetical protein
MTQHCMIAGWVSVVPTVLQCVHRDSLGMFNTFLLPSIKLLSQYEIALNRRRSTANRQVHVQVGEAEHEVVR